MIKIDLNNNMFIYNIDVIKDMNNSTEEKIKQSMKKLRDERYTSIHNKIINSIDNSKFLTVSLSEFEFESMVDEIQEMILKTKLRFTVEELRGITDYFFKKMYLLFKTDDTERLDYANKFFVELDHANNQIVNGNDDSVRLFYA